MQVNIFHKKKENEGKKDEKESMKAAVKASVKEFSCRCIRFHHQKNLKVQERQRVKHSVWPNTNCHVRSNKIALPLKPKFEEIMLV